MPHVRIDGPCDIRSYWERFEPKIHRDRDRIIKATHAYLAQQDQRVLVECTVVEGYLRQHLLAELVQKEGGALVRIFHESNPERTEGIRTCLAWIASEIIGQCPACRWAADNLGLVDHPFQSR